MTLYAKLVGFYYLTLNNVFYVLSDCCFDCAEPWFATCVNEEGELLVINNFPIKRCKITMFLLGDFE